MSEARRIAATLLHDVGKYVARTARNLPDPDSVDGPFVKMLLRDVYETYRGARASERFEELAAELAALGVADARIVQARHALAQIDALEAAARAGDGPALASIARAAIEIERELRELVREIGQYR